MRILREKYAPSIAIEIADAGGVRAIVVKANADQEDQLERIASVLALVGFVDFVPPEPEPESVPCHACGHMKDLWEGGESY